MDDLLKRLNDSIAWAKEHGYAPPEDDSKILGLPIVESDGMATSMAGKLTLTMTKIGEHSYNSLELARWPYWALGDPVSYYQQKKGNVWFGTDGNVYRWSVSEVVIE